jgi:hypothetical protein
MRTNTGDRHQRHRQETRTAGLLSRSSQGSEEGKLKLIADTVGAYEAER